MSEQVEIVRAGAERIPEFKPLWRALFDRHAEKGAALGPLLDFEESWRRRRAFYESEFERAGTFALLAERSGQVVGYAVVRLAPGSDTWVMDDPVPVVESLAVLPQERGTGVGGRLLRRAKDDLREAGYTTVRLEVLVGNDGARRLYEREGFVPRFTDMAAPL